MTDAVSTRLVTGEHRIYNTITHQTDAPSAARPSWDTEWITLATTKRPEHQTKPVADTGASDRLRAWFKQCEPTTVPSLDSVGDRQTSDMYGQDNQTSTRDIRAGAARQTYQTRDIPSIAFMDTFAGLTHDAAVEQLHHDIDAITHMGDKEVIGKLASRGLAGVAKRLRYLYDVTEEGEEDVKLDSLRGFATLMIKNRDMHLPQITVTDDGLIQAVWKHPRQGTLVMDFQESGDVEFTLLYGRWDQGTKRRKLSGELHPDQAILHVGHFVRDVMRT